MTKFGMVVLYTLDGKFQGSTDIEMTTGSLDAELMREAVERGMITPMLGLIEHINHPQKGLIVSRKDTANKEIQK